MTSDLRLSDEKYVIYTISNFEAYLGDTSKQDGNAFVEGKNIAGDISIPSVIAGYKIVGVKSYAIRNCHKLTSLILPNTIKHLELGAYTLCDLLKEVVFPASIEQIDDLNDYFRAATKIYFEENSKINTIKDYFLQHCYEVTEFVFPSSLKSLGANAFVSSSKLSKVTFCGSADLSSVESPFSGSKIILILVSPRYTGTSFGGHPFVVIPYDFCMRNVLHCETKYSIKKYFKHYSIFLFVIISK